jgi:hypothetical protein
LRRRITEKADLTQVWNESLKLVRKLLKHTAPFNPLHLYCRFVQKGIDQRKIHDDLPSLRGSGFFLDELPDKSIDPWLLLHQAFVLCSRANEKGLDPARLL